MVFVVCYVLVCVACCLLVAVCCVLFVVLVCGVVVYNGFVLAGVCVYIHENDCLFVSFAYICLFVFEFVW